MTDSVQSDDLLLRDFAPRPMLATRDTTPAQARYPAIDAHNHLGLRQPRPGGDQPPAWAAPDVDALLRMMDEVGVQAVMNLDGRWGDTLKRNVERYKERHPRRFAVLAGVDWERLDEPGFGEKMADQLEASVRAGAEGLKIFKALGLTVREASGALLRADDARLQPIWARAGALRVPVLFHIADPKAFFEPVDRFNERWEEIHAHPDWDFSGPQYPSFQALMGQQARLLERNPGTAFISAHVASCSEDLEFVGGLLDRYPNLSVDISARIAELGRQPYAARKFFLDYQDRILFGTDARPGPEVYRVHWRFLETADEHFDYSPTGRPGQGRWRIYGLSLPDEVLARVYRLNALRLFPSLGQ